MQLSQPQEPPASHDAGTQKVEPGMQAMTAGTISILLVEDSVLIRAALEDAVSLVPAARFGGFATTASQAIDLLRERAFDMVVLDIQLSQGNGFDVLHNMAQADFPFPRPIVMMLTNHALPDYKRRADLFGVKYFFDKSMHFNDAIDVIEQEATRLLGNVN